MSENASITVAEAAEIWIEKGEIEKLERSTLRQYRNHVDLHIKPSRIGTEKLARLSTAAIEAFRDDMLRKCSRPMARKVLASLKSILGEAQRRGLVAQNVAQPVKVDAKKREQGNLKIGRDIPCKNAAEGSKTPQNQRTADRNRIMVVEDDHRSVDPRGQRWMRWRVPRDGSATPCAASSQAP